MNTQMTKSDINIEKLNSQLDEWKAEIDKLGAKALQASDEAELSYMRDEKNLKVSYAEAELKLNEMRNAQERASSDIMDGVTNAWRDLGNAVSKAAKRFG